MFTILQPVAGRAAALALAAATVTACASPAPRIGSDAMQRLSALSVEAGPGEMELAAALETAPLPDGGASPLTARVTIDVVRYNAPFIGLFYGGPDHASLSVRLESADGTPVESFTVNVGVDALGTQADGALARKAVAIIAGRAAAAWPAMTPKPKAVVAAAPEPAAPKPAAPAADIAADAPPADAGEPCVIGADGKCLPL